MKSRIRANVVLELIKSEQDYVKHLKDVVEGYLYPARRHPEIFTGERINTIFSNIEQLYEFQRKFLESLETCIDWSNLADSCVGQCFLQYEKGFSVYHYYCNNHPNASSELQELYAKTRFVKFFEACRLLQNMIDISLDGFLLTPIQKICKYPLQLNELLKNTDEDHPDYECVVNALESMKNCANLANERKRRIEALADVMSFQEKVENWFGPKICDTSSILIHTGELSMTSQSTTWSQNVQLYLFDHLLLYAKKDLLKRNSLILRGRISMDTVTEIADADEKQKRSFKLYCSEQDKWFIFITKNEQDKDEWIRAFERERSLVESDELEGFHITDKEIGIARRTLQNRKHSRSARYPRHKRPDTAIVDQLDLGDANAIMNRTLSLPSCIHPSHVMNFVEDSRVVSSGNSRQKATKGNSPICSQNSRNEHHQMLSSNVSSSTSTRSPVISSTSHLHHHHQHQLLNHHQHQLQQHLQQQTNINEHQYNLQPELSPLPSSSDNQTQTTSQQQTATNATNNHQEASSSASGATGWFRKMGSKKLARSQVYQINGNTGSSPSSLIRSAVSASNIGKGIVSSSNSNSKVSGYVLADTTTGTFIDMNTQTAASKYDQLERRHREHMSIEEQARLFRLNNDLPANFDNSPTSNKHQQHQISSTSDFSSPLSERLNRTLNLSTGNSPVDTSTPPTERRGCARDRQTMSAERRPKSNGPSYETTVILSSGRIVKLREDAV